MEERGGVLKVFTMPRAQLYTYLSDSSAMLERRTLLITETRAFDPWCSRAVNYSVRIAEELCRDACADTRDVEIKPAARFVRDPNNLSRRKTGFHGVVVIFVATVYTNCIPKSANRAIIHNGSTITYKYFKLTLIIG